KDSRVRWISPIPRTVHPEAVLFAAMPSELREDTVCPLPPLSQVTPSFQPRFRRAEQRPQCPFPSIKKHILLNVGDCAWLTAFDNIWIEDLIFVLASFFGIIAKFVNRVKRTQPVTHYQPSERLSGQMELE